MLYIDAAMELLAESIISITASSYLRSDMSLTLADKKASEEYAGAINRDIAIMRDIMRATIIPTLFS